MSSSNTELLMDLSSKPKSSSPSKDTCLETPSAEEIRRKSAGMDFLSETFGDDILKTTQAKKKTNDDKTKIKKKSTSFDKSQMK